MGSNRLLKWLTGFIFYIMGWGMGLLYLNHMTEVKLAEAMNQIQTQLSEVGKFSVKKIKANWLGPKLTFYGVSYTPLQPEPEFQIDSVELSGLSYINLIQIARQETKTLSSMHWKVKNLQVSQLKTFGYNELTFFIEGQLEASDNYEKLKMNNFLVHSPEMASVDFSAQLSDIVWSGLKIERFGLDQISINYQDHSLISHLRYHWVDPATIIQTVAHRLPASNEQQSILSYLEKPEQLLKITLKPRSPLQYDQLVNPFIWISILKNPNEYGLSIHHIR